MGNSIQRCPPGWGLIFFLVNIFFPGFGTMFSAFCAAGCNFDAFLVGLLQLILAPVFLIGWIWSIVWGWKIFEASK